VPPICIRSASHFVFIGPRATRHLHEKISEVSLKRSATAYDFDDESRVASVATQLARAPARALLSRTDTLIATPPRLKRFAGFRRSRQARPPKERR
jgi:hypothetical protein